MATLQNTDKILVNRADETYSITFAELRNSVVTTTNTYRQQVKDLMRAADDVKDDDLFLVERAGDPYKVTYKEIVDSVKPPAPPVISNVSLVENNPGALPRFTDQEFTTTVTLSDQGEPLSEKSIDAYVEGTFKSSLRSTNPITNVVDVDPDWEYCPVDGNETNSSVGYGMVAAAPDGVVIAVQPTAPTLGSGDPDTAIYRSTDGLNFTKVTGTPSLDKTSSANLLYFNGQFVIYGQRPSNSRPCFIVSSDGLNWEYKEVTGFTNGELNSQRIWKAETDGTRIVLTFTLGNNIDCIPITTTDLTTFERVTIDTPLNNRAESIVYGDGVWLMCDGKSRLLWRSTDGVTWQSQAFTLPSATYYASDLGYSNGRWWVRTKETGKDYVSDDEALTWQEITPSPNLRGNLDSTMTINGLFAACGPGFVENFDTGNFATSPDAINWTAGDPAFFDSTRCGQAAYSTFHKKFYVACAYYVVRSTVPVTSKRLILAGALTDGFLISEAVTSDPPGGGVSTIIDLDDTSVLVTEGGTWLTDQHLIGRDMYRDGIKQYLTFDSDGDIVSFQDQPMDPKWTTMDEQPTLTLKFPGIFPSGMTPDEELSDGVVLGVEARAYNSVGTSGPVTAQVQPSDGLVNFDEPLQSIDENGWTVTSAPVSYTWKVMTYGVPSTGTYAGQGIFVVLPVSASATEGVTSTDAITWSTNTLSDSCNWNNIVYAVLDEGTYAGQGVFVSVASNLGTGSGAQQAAVSNDGLTWTRSNIPQNGTWNGLCVGVPQAGPNYQKTTIVACSGSKGPVGQFAYTTNGQSWTTASTPMNANVWRSVAFGNDIFVAVASDGSDRFATSNDGNVWSKQIVSGDQETWYDIAFGAGKFVAISTTDKFAVSENGTSWNIYDAPESNTWRSITYGNGRFVAVASNGTNRIVQSADGLNWYASAIPVNQQWAGCTFGADKFLVGSFDNTTNMIWSKNAGVPTLNFDSSADMTTLAPADPLTQEGGGSGFVGEVNGTSVDLATPDDGWQTQADGGANVIGPRKPDPNIRSMTVEELEAQKLKFGTYKNRKMIYCGIEAAQERAALRESLKTQGYTDAELDDVFIGD